MKKIWVIGSVLFVIFSATSSFAANSVNISGNLKMDGYLTIDINWVVDTAKYPVKESIRQKVYDEIWGAVMPKLVKNMGEPAKCAQTKFTKLFENKKLLKQRPDGSKVYDYSTTIRFDCSMGVVQEKGTPMSPETFTEGFHDGFTNEADSF